MVNLIPSILASFFLLIVILLVTGRLYQAIATAKDRQKYPPLGELVDVGGYQLHINCIGEGSPTVVMDYGIGSLSLIWSLIQPEVAKFTRVCTYDRAGYAWSDSSPDPRTSQQMVKELYTLLHNAQIPGPFVLVGHSLGGLNVRLFASQYPEEVVGIVLVDAVPDNVYSRLVPEFQQTMTAFQEMFRRLSIISRLGLLRLSLQLRGAEGRPDFVRKLPIDVQPIFMAMFGTKTIDTAMAENRLMERSAKQVSSTKLPNDLPIVVISHGVNMFLQFDANKAEQAESRWQELQAEMAKLSSKGRLQIASQSGHNPHIDQPQLIIDAIRQIVEEI